MQYQALLSTERVELRFTDEAVREMARFAMEVNAATENIGARRLATILETVLEDISFEAGERGPRTVTLDAEAVRQRLTPLVQDQDLSRFIL
jgi:ATP-dependent HslUV protease ATP-binding subunit HslU